MPSKDPFLNISIKVIRDLDSSFSDWRSLVPEDTASKLNEETLIKLLKDKKRAAIYRKISDRREELFKEAYEDQTKDFFAAAQEFAQFTYEQTQAWLDMESKLSTIILEFRAKKEIVDVNKLGDDLNVVSNKLGEYSKTSINEFNSNMDNQLDAFFSRGQTGQVGTSSSELKGFLKEKVNQFKEENREIADQQTNFINSTVKGLINSKLEKIKSGELSEDALNRSDLFTDEEMENVRQEQFRVIFDSTKKRQESNIRAINEAAQKFIGTSGKENILRSLEGLPENIITPRVKRIVSDAMDYGCILDNEDSSSGRSKRLAPALIAGILSTALDIAAYQISQFHVEGAEEDDFFNKDKLYRFCNSDTYYTAHIFTFGFCSGYTVGKNMRAKKMGINIDYKGIASVLSTISFFIGLFSLKPWYQLLYSVLAVGNKLISEAGCKALGDSTGSKTASNICEATLLVAGVTTNWGLSNASGGAKTLGEFMKHIPKVVSASSSVGTANVIYKELARGSTESKKKVKE